MGSKYLVGDAKIRHLSGIAEIERGKENNISFLKNHMGVNGFKPSQKSGADVLFPQHKRPFVRANSSSRVRAAVGAKRRELN